MGFSWDDLNPFAQRNEGQYGGVNQQNFAVPGSDSLGAYFQNEMAGTDSLAQQKLQQAQAQNVAQQTSMAAGAAPGNVAAAQLAAMQNVGRLNQGATGQGIMAGIAERAAGASGQLGLSQLQQQGNEEYERNRSARAGAAMNAPTWGEQAIGAGLGAAKVAAMATGGVVTQPTHALIGEAGPEAVIPLAQLPGLLQTMQPGAARPILPGEQAKSAPGEGGPRFVPTPPPPPPPPLGYFGMPGGAMRAKK